MEKNHGVVLCFDPFFPVKTKGFRGSPILQETKETLTLVEALYLPNLFLL